MDPLFDLLDTAAGRIIAWGGAIAVLAGLARWMWRQSKRLHQLVDALLGDPARGVPGLPERTAAIEKQLHPNGGTSLRDAVDGTRSELAEVRRDLGAHLAEHARGPVTVNVSSQAPPTT